MKKTIAIAVLMPGLFSLTFCAPPAPSKKSGFSNEVEESMSTEDRAKYCLTKSAPEDNQATADIVAQLSGDWKRRNKDGNEITFIFKPSRSYVSEETNYGWYMNRQDISYRKICISKPLGPDAGNLADYRLVELMASDNEGGAAFVMKFETPENGHSYPVLRMTQPYYQRWGSTHFLQLSDIVEKKKILIYRDRQ